MYDPVAPPASAVRPEDVQATHFESGAPLRLQRGEMGTAVMTYDNGMCEVEFSDQEGRASAMLPLSADRLLVLYDAPERAGMSCAACKGESITRLTCRPIR